MQQTASKVQSGKNYKKKINAFYKKNKKNPQQSQKRQQQMK